MAYSRRYLITLLMTTPYEWSADYGRQTARELSKKHVVWCYVWHTMPSLKELLLGTEKCVVLERKDERVWVYTAIHWLPFKRFQFIVRLNQRINVLLFRFLQWVVSMRNHFDSRLLWVFDTAFFELKRLFRYDKVLYDSLDFFAGALNGNQRKNYERTEKRFILEADFLFANSHFLYNRIKQLRSDVKLVPQGFSVEEFTHKTVVNIVDRKRKVVGYVGGINKRLDYSLLFSLIADHPNWDFEFWGPSQLEDGDLSTQKHIEVLQSFGNVRLGQVKRSALGKVISRFDVGTIPYVPSEFNTYCFPMKLFEYFYFGKRVVSCPIDELMRAEYEPFVGIANSKDEWERQLTQALSAQLTGKEKRIQFELALSHSWSEKISIILNTVESRV